MPPVCADFQYGAPGEGFSRVCGAFLVPEAHHSVAGASGADDDGKRRAEWEGFESQVSQSCGVTARLCLF
jgi:hypothetical protein